MGVHWKLGDTIANRWVVHRVLGGHRKSGMGIVYVVYDVRDQMVYAAKTFQDELFGRHPQIADRFLEEARAWVELGTHRNVVQAYFAQRIAGKPFLFLEYVSEGDLGRWIGPRLTEDLPQVLRFSIHLCDAMIYVRSRGIRSHRDIKPQNCLIGMGRNLKLTDFGLARLDDGLRLSNDRADEVAQSDGGSAVGSAPTTGAAGVVGTPQYMAPEQFTDSSVANERSDIYSFGVMLFQLITSRLPFVVAERTPAQTWAGYRHAHQESEPPEAATKSSTLDAVVRTCLAKVPSKRFRDFGELREALAQSYLEVTGAPLEQPGASTGTGQEEELSRTSEGDGVTELLNRCHSYHNLGLEARALEVAEECVRTYPSVADSWSNRGAILAAMGRREEALACYDRAIELNPTYSQALTNKAATLARLGRHDEAVRCCDKVLASDPLSVEAWQNRGVALARLGRYDEALACCEAALKYDRFLPQAWNTRAVNLLKLEDEMTLDAILAIPEERLRHLGEAFRSVFEALDMDPGYSNAQHNLRALMRLALLRLPRTSRCERWLWKAAVQDHACLEMMFKSIFRSTTRLEFHPRYLRELKEGSLGAVLTDNQAMTGLLTSVLGLVLEQNMSLMGLARDADAQLRLGLHALNARLQKLWLLEVPTATGVALAPYVDTDGERLQVAKSMNEAGMLYRQLGEYPAALRCYDLAYPLYESVGDRTFCAHVHYNRGRVYGSRREQGDCEAARDAFSRALAMYQDLGMEDGIADVRAQLDSLG